MKRILLTGARAPAALELARQFAAAGCEVFMADRPLCPPCKGSRAVAATLTLPPARRDPAGYVDALLEIVRARGIDMLVPTCEEIFFIARHADRLRAETELFAVDLSLLARLHDKYLFAREGAAASVRTPATDLLKSAADVQETAHRAARSVYKPAFSRFASHVLLSPDPARLRSVRPTPEYPWLRQDRIDGVEYCTWSAARDGRLVAHVCYLPRHRLRAGASYYFDAVDKPKVRDYVAAFVAERRFTGQLGFDLIEDADGDFWALECNPRLTSGAHLFPRDGALAKALLGETPKGAPPLQPPVGAAGMLALGMLLFSFPRALLSPSRLRAVAADFGRARDVLFERRDPLPAAMQFVTLTEYVLRGLLNRETPKEAATWDIEWNGEPL